MNFGILMVHLLRSLWRAVKQPGRCAGFRQRLFESAYPELRRRPERAHPQGHPQCGPDLGALLHLHQRDGLPVCLAADGHLHRRFAGGHHRCRRPLSAHRGRVLYRHRHPLPALRLLPCRQSAGNVGGADHRLPTPAWHWPTCYRPLRWASPVSGSASPSAGRWRTSSASDTIW